MSPQSRAVLVEFFRVERSFFLTGGGALVGYHLHHRLTDDLDLFTLDAATFERGDGARRSDGATLPGGVVAETLRTYVAELVKRLRRAAAPSNLGP